MNQDPKTYLSKHNNLWSLIHKGEPLCAPTTHAQCLEVVRSFNARYSNPIVLPSVYWCSDAGSFVPCDVP